MPFYKITKSFNAIEDPSRLYFGCSWEIREDGIYADVPEYAIDSYVEAGRVFPIDLKAEAEAAKDKAENAAKAVKDAQALADKETAKAKILEAKVVQVPQEKVKSVEEDFDTLLNSLDEKEEPSAEEVVEGTTEEAKDKKRKRRTRAEIAADAAKSKEGK